MSIKVFELDVKTLKPTKKIIGEFSPKTILFPVRRQLKRMLDASNVGDENFDSEKYNDFLDEIKKIAGYTDELMNKYTDVHVDTVLLQTYAAWQPSEKK